LDGLLKDAIRFHHAEVVNWLLTTGQVEPDQDAGIATIQYSNFDALSTLMDPASGSKRKSFVFGPPTQQGRGAGYGQVVQVYDTVFHVCGKYNAIESFKYLALRHAGQFNPYETTDKSQAFLHYGCRFAGYEVVRFWCRNFGNMGLNAVDDFNFNPGHYVFVLGSNPRAPKKEPKDPYIIKRPFWHYMKKRSRPDYSKEEDQELRI
jgi:hypothetical protein